MFASSSRAPLAHAVARPPARAAVVARAALGVGAKVRVKSSVVVYHVPKSKGAATDLIGMTGVVDSRADAHEGATTSATLAVKVAIPNPNGGKDFIAHLDESELEET